MSSDDGVIAAGGTGKLAQVIASRGGLAAPEEPFVIEHREAFGRADANVFVKITSQLDRGVSMSQPVTPGRS
jgi:hypothetical protein